MFHRFYLTTIALLLSLSTVAQVAVRDMRGLTREQIDSIVRPKVSPQGAELLRCESDTHELGTLSEDDEPVSHTFILRNVSDRSVRIQRVRTTCGCTEATFDTTAIAPGATTKVTLTRDKINLEDSAAQSEIKTVKDPKSGKQIKVGIINLPSFYMNFEEAARGNANARRASTDVKNILEKSAHLISSRENVVYTVKKRRNHTKECPALSKTVGILLNALQFTERAHIRLC